MIRIRLQIYLFINLVVLVPALLLATLSQGQPACIPTPYDSLGPFYQPNTPERDRTGRGLVVYGRVLSSSGCIALAKAKIEWWSTNSQGEYDDKHRATQKVDPDGRYRYETDFPGHYTGRPPHLHVRVTASGYRTLITQIYPKEDQKSLYFDFVITIIDRIIEIR